MKEIIVLVVPEGTTREELNTAIHKVLKTYEQKVFPFTSKNKTVVKSQQELFEEIINAALSQYKERRKVVANLTPSWSSLSKIEQLDLVFEAEPELLEKLLNAGITGEQGNTELLLRSVAKHGLWELPLFVKALRKS